MIDEIGLLRDIEQEAYEIEHHIHTRERWLAAKGGWTGLDEDTEVEVTGFNHFQLDSGNNDWGTALCIIGSDDTPVIADMTKFDPHEILIESAEKNVQYYIRMAWGTSYAAAVGLGNYSDEPFIPSVGRQSGGQEVSMHMIRLDSGTKIFAATKCESDTGTIDFIIGIHEYVR